MTPTSIGEHALDKSALNTFSTIKNSDALGQYYHLAKFFLKEANRDECIDQIGWEIYFNKTVEIGKRKYSRQKAEFNNCLEIVSSSEPAIISKEIKYFLELLPEPWQTLSTGGRVPGLYVHECVEEGLKINRSKWTKAKELYNRIKKHEADNI